MIELKRAKSKISMSPTVWAMSLELARLCGWSPLGTRRVEQVNGVVQVQDVLEDVRHRLPWQMEYVAGDGQTVVREDADHLADAFCKAVAEGEMIIARWSAGQIEPPAVLRTPSTGFRWFSTIDGKDHLQAVADFCRLGEFQIF